MTCARVTPPVSSLVEFYAVQLEIVSISGNPKGKIQPRRAFKFYGAILKNLDKFNQIPWSKWEGLKKADWCSTYPVNISRLKASDHSENGAEGEKRREEEGEKSAQR